MRSAMEKSQNITIIGGGYISIELIEAFVKNKKNVTLVERSPFILSVFDEDISSLIQSFILENSDGLVKILNEDQVCEFVGDETVTGVLTTNGSGFETDMAVIATGVYPVVDIAKEAGIEIGTTGAIKVNSRMETNIPDIYACGDCAERLILFRILRYGFRLALLQIKKAGLLRLMLAAGSRILREFSVQLF